MEEKMRERKTGKKRLGEIASVTAVVALAVIMALTFLAPAAYADPDGPSEVVSVSNETKSTTAPFEINYSGGFIYTINITAVTQNLKWKAFIGNVTGKFTLDDSASSTIFDWDLTSVSGEVYATRNSSTINWAGIACANSTQLENENLAMNLTSADDNITTTFSQTNHSGFFVGSTPIAQDSCPSLNTYVSDAPQTSVFDEVALADTFDNIIYATIMEQSEVGYNDDLYDFQMIVPEIGTPGFSGSTAYYLYVELE